MNMEILVSSGSQIRDMEARVACGTTNLEKEFSRFHEPRLTLNHVDRHALINETDGRRTMITGRYCDRKSFRSYMNKGINVVAPGSLHRSPSPWVKHHGLTMWWRIFTSMPAQ